MKSKRFVQIAIFLATACLAASLSVQFFLSQRTITAAEQQLNHSIQMALQNVVDGLCHAAAIDTPVRHPVERVSSNFFVVRIDNRIDIDLLQSLLTTELLNRGILEDFEYGVYDCQTDAMAYGKQVPKNQITSHKDNKNRFILPSSYDYYFTVYFPSLKFNILWGQMSWRYTLGISLAFLLFFGYALWVILLQRRWADVQRDFYNNVAHELKTPLSSLKMATEVMEASPTKQDYLNIIKKETTRLEKLIMRILATEKLEYQYKLNLKTVNLSHIINDVAFQKQGQYSEKKFSVNVSENIVFRTDELYLETVLSNLLDNAAKYGRTSVGVSAHQAEGKVSIFIVDDGDGIPINERKKIFQKFYRIPTGNLFAASGFGLGLYVVKKMVERLGGKISIVPEKFGKFLLEFKCKK